jgi:hypothetical protein
VTRDERRLAALRMFIDLAEVDDAEKTPARAALEADPAGALAAMVGSEAWEDVLLRVVGALAQRYVSADDSSRVWAGAWSAEADHALEGLGHLRDLGRANAKVGRMVHKGMPLPKGEETRRRVRQLTEAGRSKFEIAQDLDVSLDTVAKARKATRG